jgi:hypothetical protein
VFVQFVRFFFPCFVDSIILKFLRFNSTFNLGYHDPPKVSLRIKKVRRF